jgi:hypothetical protein
MKDLFTLGAWSLQEDTVLKVGNRTHIASIRHQCRGSGATNGHTIWFNDKSSITMCYCGAIVPDEIQTLCVLFNMEWIQGT